jgi:hypothetical protein
MKTTNTKQGRPVKPPPKDLLEYHLSKERKIFEAYGAPKTWSDKEFRAVWAVLIASHFSGQKFAVETLAKNWIGDAAETFARMWIEARDVMIRAMPKLAQLANKAITNPQVRYR